MKGQSSLEFVSIIGIALALTTPLIVTSQSISADFIRSSSSIQFSSSLDSLSNSVDRAGSIVGPYKSYVVLDIPFDLESVTKVENFAIEIESERLSSEGYNLVLEENVTILDFPTEERSSRVSVSNQNDKIWIAPEEFDNYLNALIEYGIFSFNAKDIIYERQSLSSIPNQLSSTSISTNTEAEITPSGEDPQYGVEISDTVEPQDLSITYDKPITLALVFYPYLNSSQNSDLVSVNSGSDTLLDVRFNQNDVIYDSDSIGTPIDQSINQGQYILISQLTPSNQNITIIGSQEGIVHQNTIGGQSYRNLNASIGGQMESQFVMSEFVVIEDESNKTRNYLTRKWS